MADGFKVPVKMVVDGETDFKKAMKDCASAMKVLDSESKALSATYDDNAKSLDALARQQEIANTKVDLQKQKLNALADQLEKLAQTEGDTTAQEAKLTKQFFDTQAQLSKLEAEAKKANKEYEDHSSITGRLKDAYENAKKGLEDFKEAHPKLTKAVEVAGKTVEGLAKGGLALLETGAKATMASIGALTAGAVALGKAVWDSAEAAAEYGDAIDKNSQKMDISAEEYQKLQYAVELSGTSMETLQKATVKLQNAGSDLDISQAIDQIMQIEDADQRAAAAQEMFGAKIANELAPMLNEGGKALEDAKQKALDYGLVMSDSAVKASAAFSDTKDTLTSTVTSIKNNLASEFLPGLNTVMEGITGLFTGDDSASDKIEEGVNSIIESLDTVLDRTINILGMLIDKVVELAPKVITSLSEGILNNLDKIIDAAFEIVQTLAEDLLTEENITLIMNSAVGLIVKLVEFLANNADMLIDSAVMIVTTLIEAFSNPENSQTLVNGCIDMLGAIVGALIENAPLLLEATVDMGKALVKGLLEYDWSKLAKGIYSKIKDAIVGLFKGGDEKDGGHAGGLDYVPYNGYSAVLHQGEKVLTSAEAEAMRNNNSDISQLNSKVDYLMSHQNNGDVNINVSGSAGAVVRALNVEIEREGRRKSAWA